MEAAVIINGYIHIVVLQKVNYYLQFALAYQWKVEQSPNAFCLTFNSP